MAKWKITALIDLLTVSNMHCSLVESGTPILRGLEPSPFGLNFVFQDPDGYAVTVHGNR